MRFWEFYWKVRCFFGWHDYAKLKGTKPFCNGCWKIQKFKCPMHDREDCACG